jgi:ADP-ribose pyrophosphatase YjhB (NUDIX family)
MRQAVRAIIIKDSKLLVIERNKFGHVYYTLPGGGLELHETPEQALTRELAEETGVLADIDHLVTVEEAGEPYGTQFVYLCHYQSGEPALHPDSEEAKLSALGQNTYTPLWLPLTRLDAVLFRSEKLKAKLKIYLENGFPDAPEML